MTEALSFYPVDVWTVRDGRPFDVGGVVHARALWPPSPWTVAGAIRTALCEAIGVPAVDYGARADNPAVRRAIELLGPPDGPPTFCLGPALLTHEAEAYWPVPADIATFTDQRLIRSSRLRARRSEQLRAFGCAWSRSERALTLLPPLPPEGFEHPDKSVELKYFTHQQLEAWLQSAAIPTVPQNGHRLPLKSESRIGIEIDDARGTVMEGRFYIRYAHALGDPHALASEFSLRVPVVEPGGDGVPWKALDAQHVRLGADGHLAWLRWEPAAFQWPGSRAEGGRGALLFLSPVHPGDLVEPVIHGTAVTVEAICAGRPVAIGGWQLRRDGHRQSGPRPMRPYYPPGTVIYVRAEGDLNRLHARSIARDPEERAAGFGFCLVGNSPAVEE